MTLQELNCFLTVAETLSYTKTAQQLFISQPTVSKHIQTLESEIGAPLFNRSIRRSIRLTAAGELLKECLQRCKKDFDNTMIDISFLASHSPIVLNFHEGCTAPKSLIETLHIFDTKHTEFSFSLNFIPSTQYTTALNNGELVICEKESIPANKQYIMHPLKNGTVSYYLLASSQHAAFLKNPQPHASDFSGCPLFLSNSMHPSQIAEYREILNEAHVEPSEFVYVDSIESTLIYLYANRAFTLVGGWSHGLFDPNFKAVKLQRKTNYYLVWNPQKVLNQSLSELVQML